MTDLFDHRNTDPVDVTPYRDFFRKHSNMDLDRLIACTSMEEFITALRAMNFISPCLRSRSRKRTAL